MERLKLRTAETDSSSCVLVSRDDAMGFLGSKNRCFCLHKIGDEGATALVTRLAGRLRTSRIVANTVQVSVQETLAYEGVIYVFFIKKWYIQKIVVSL